MYELSVTEHFDAAHWLENYDGKCRELHGHRWEVMVTIVGTQLNSGNMLIDFSKIKHGLKTIVDDMLDHKCLNTSLGENNPTAEFLARYIYSEFYAQHHLWQISNKVALDSVTVWESPEYCATFRSD